MVIPSSTMALIPLPICWQVPNLNLRFIPHFWTPDLRTEYDSHLYLGGEDVKSLPPGHLSLAFASWPLSFSVDGTSIFPVCSDKKTWNHPQLLFFSFILNPIHPQIEYLSCNNMDESQNYNIEWQKAGSKRIYAVYSYVVIRVQIKYQMTIWARYGRGWKQDLGGDWIYYRYHYWLM